MKSKGGVVLLTVVISLLSLYHLSFTYVSNGIEDEITEYAEQKVSEADAGSNLDSIRKISRREKKKEYGDKSIYLGKTYDGVKKSRLNLGLDLQGGMHITCIVSPVDIIKALANHSTDEAFNEALVSAKRLQRTEQLKLAELFYREYKEKSNNTALNVVFLSPDNSKITFNTTDDEIMDIINREVDDAINRVERVLTLRLDKFGTTQPKINKVAATGRLEIEMPGVDENDQERIIKLITDVVNLEFLGVLDVQEYGEYIGKINSYLLAQRKENEVSGEGAASSTEDGLFEDQSVEESEDELSEEIVEEGDDETLFDDEGGSAITSGDEEVAEEEIDPTEQAPILEYFQISPQGSYFAGDKTKRDEIDELINSDVMKSILPADVRIVWGIPETNAEATEEQLKFVQMYFVKRDLGGAPLLSGEAITEAYPTNDEMGRPAVSMQMNMEGASKWAKITGDFAKTRKRIAVVLDDVVYSAPGVNQAIPTGSSIISGNFTYEEASDLANILKAGKLPAPTHIERMVIVGPSLGQAAKDRGLMSIMVGLALVVVFMIAYYSKGGVVANMALLFNIFFILGIMSTPYLGVVLTLPGIAGIVLTIGMSIDANVLIFERIKEELASGKSLKGSIDNGYKRAFWTIFDANVTTLITGIILAVFGSGLIKGFAWTLIIGIFCSFFSAVFITRLFIEKMASKEGATLKFDTVISKGLFQNLNINFIGKRKMAYIISSLVIVVGLSTVVMQGGLNLGVAFKGGHSYVVKFDEGVNSSEVKAEIKATGVFGEADVDVKTFDTESQLQITTSYLIDSDDEGADSLVLAALHTGLAKYQKLNPREVQSIEVDASIADDIKYTSIKSVIVALIAIFIYIVLRFRKWQFGAGAIFALFHDVLIVISVFSITRLLGISFEIDEVFIAAMLTIVGYSINDTVVVFDRVREFLTDKPNNDLATNINLSINSTISRTLMTSFTTLLVVAILFVFGGEALRGFSFALLIGVVVGTYSSIFIATPVVLDASSAGKKEEK